MNWKIQQLMYTYYEFFIDGNSVINGKYSKLNLKTSFSYALLYIPIFKEFINFLTIFFENLVFLRGI